MSLFIKIFQYLKGHCKMGGGSGNTALDLKRDVYWIQSCAGNLVGLTTDPLILCLRYMLSNIMRSFFSDSNYIICIYNC